MNKCCLVGRITKDVEIRYTPNQNACVMFTLAVNRDFRNPDGSYGADFISCVAWNNQAEFLSKYVKKGYMLSVSGRIQTRTYQTQNGETRAITEVIADSVENLTPKPQEQQPQYNPNQPQYNSYQPQQQMVNAQYKQEPKNMMEQIKNAPQQVFDVTDEDLPF